MNNCYICNKLVTTYQICNCINRFICENDYKKYYSQIVKNKKICIKCNKDILGLKDINDENYNVEIDTLNTINIQRYRFIVCMR